MSERLQVPDDTTIFTETEVREAIHHWFDFYFSNHKYNIFDIRGYINNDELGEKMGDLKYLILDEWFAFQVRTFSKEGPHT